MNIDFWTTTMVNVRRRLKCIPNLFEESENLNKLIIREVNNTIGIYWKRGERFAFDLSFDRTVGVL